MNKIKIVMLRDSPGKKGGALFSPNSYWVEEKYANGLILTGKARLYELSDVKRTVNLDGKEMTWSEYLKLRRKNAK